MDNKLTPKEREFVHLVSQGEKPSTAVRELGLGHTGGVAWTPKTHANYLLARPEVRDEIIKNLQATGIQWTLLMDRVKRKMVNLLDAKDDQGNPVKGWGPSHTLALMGMIIQAATKLNLLTSPDDYDEKEMTRNEAARKFLGIGAVPGSEETKQ